MPAPQAAHRMPTEHSRAVQGARQSAQALQAVTCAAAPVCEFLGPLPAPHQPLCKLVSPVLCACGEAGRNRGGSR